MPQAPEVGRCEATLDELHQAVGSVLLPLFDAFVTPRELAARMPDDWLGMLTAVTVEWAIAHRDPGAAKVLVQRHMSRPERGQDTWEARARRFSSGYDLADPTAQDLQTYSTKAIGWVCREHDLLAPADLMPTK